MALLNLIAFLTSEDGETLENFIAYSFIVLLATS